MNKWFYWAWADCFFRLAPKRRLYLTKTKAADLEKSDPVLRSRHLFGRLRLRKSEVPELTPAPTKLGRPRLQAKRRLQSAPAPYTNSFHFELLESELLMQVFFRSHLPLKIDLRSCFVTTTRLSYFACQKDAAGAASSGQQKIRIQLHPKSGGSRRLRLRYTGKNDSFPLA